MMRPYKKALIASSIATLLPIPIGLLLWSRFPETMAVHWGITGQPDGWAGPALTVIAVPLMMLALHLLCFFFTLRDPGNKGRNKKPLTLVLWIVPLICNLSCYCIYALALGVEFSVSTWMMAAIGAMFAVIGNYMPKMKMNSTMGIKVPWTYSSEENWNATHRFGGKVWMIGGMILMFCAFLPEALAGAAMLAGLLVMTVIPVVYSYRYYKRQQAAGAALKPFAKAETAITKWSLAILLVVILLVLAVLFVGNIHFEFRENYLFIEADLYNDHVLYYDAIESVEYREGNVEGLRVGGYGSLRLLMGYFKNDEFGVYTRYTYYKPEACLVITTDGRTLVLSGETKEDTQHLYQQLREKISK